MQCTGETGTYHGNSPGLWALISSQSHVLQICLNPQGPPGAPSTIWGPCSVSGPPAWVQTTAKEALSGFQLLLLPPYPTPYLASPPRPRQSDPVVSTHHPPLSLALGRSRNTEFTPSRC